MVRAARLVANHGRPVLGINLGQLGFLAGFAPARRCGLPGARRHAGADPRMRLAVTFRRHGAEPMVRYALNDAVLHQGAMARLVEIDAFVDDEFVASYRADGLIVATPTGSTAYNMAAGGPIVLPGQAAMTLTPICAHALTNRPLVISASNTIRLQLGADVRGVLITVDAQWGHSFLHGDVVDIAAATSCHLFASNRLLRRDAKPLGRAARPGSQGGNTCAPPTSRSSATRDRLGRHERAHRRDQGASR
jgi:NAD+ kinase